jgi:hypothetical protein
MRSSHINVAVVCLMLRTVTSAAVVDRRDLPELGCDAEANAPKCREESITDYESGYMMVHGIVETCVPHSPSRFTDNP